MYLVFSKSSRGREAVAPGWLKGGNPPTRELSVKSNSLPEESKTKCS